MQATGEGKTTSVDVPPLNDAPAAIASGPAATAPAAAAAPAAEQAPASSSHGSAQRIGAVAVAGVGVVGVAIGSVFGAGAISKNSDANKGHCTGNTCDSTGVSLRQDAVHAGNLSTVAFVVGGVALAGGAVLWFTAPSTTASRPPPRWAAAATAPSSAVLGSSIRGALDLVEVKDPEGARGVVLLLDPGDEERRQDAGDAVDRLIAAAWIPGRLL